MTAKARSKLANVTRVGEPTTKAGNQLVTDVSDALSSIRNETTEPVVRMWMKEVGPTLVQLVKVGVILTEKEARDG